MKVTQTAEGDLLLASSTASPSAFLLPKARISAFLHEPHTHSSTLYRFRGLGGHVVSLMLSSNASSRRLDDNNADPTVFHYWPGVRFDVGILVVAYSEVPLRKARDPVWQRHHGLDLVVRPTEIIACDATRTPDLRRLLVDSIPKSIDYRHTTPDAQEIAKAIRTYYCRPRKRWEWR